MTKQLYKIKINYEGNTYQQYRATNEPLTLLSNIRIRVDDSYEQGKIVFVKWLGPVEIIEK